jgi:hypothetical protein
MFHTNKLLIIHTWIKLGSELLANNKFLCNAPPSVDEEIHGSVPPWRFCLVSDRQTDTKPSYRSTCLPHGPLRETGSIFQASAGFGDSTTTWRARYLALPPQALSDLAITQTLKTQRITLPLIPLPQRRTCGSDKLENCNDNGLKRVCGTKG